MPGASQLAVPNFRAYEFFIYLFILLTFSVHVHERVRDSGLGKHA